MENWWANNVGEIRDLSFNSWVFILLFLPVALIGYQILVRGHRFRKARIWLFLVSIFFYAYGGTSSLVVLGLSMLVNYLIVTRAFSGGAKAPGAKTFLIAGITANIALLAYLKYFYFARSVLNGLIQINFHPPEPLIMLGISFITFQQISFLVDAYRGKIAEFSPLDYILYITFFPKIISGPITRFNELVPVLQAPAPIRAENLAKGVYVFAIGLFKKVVVADTLAKLAAAGFDSTAALSFLEGWITSLSYTAQIYFDFSGYTDMALGAALMFNIRLPFNFNSPYRALNIRDFWSRWHITLTRFLTEYVYIPLGGSRQGEGKALRNIMITFILSGFWHGADWTFIFWGFLHGAASVSLRLWGRLGITMPRLLAWFLTFNFVNIAWIFFRAEDFQDAIRVLQGMFVPVSWSGTQILASFSEANLWLAAVVSVAGLIILLVKTNSNAYSTELTPSWRKVLLIAAMVLISVLFLNTGVPKEFIYNDF